jgi:hypothetical protein
MTTHVPPSVQCVLDEYVRQLGENLPGFLEGLYLHGSLALGAFESRLSDIDFIVVASRRCTANDLVRLHVIHETLKRTYSKYQLEGAYLCWNDLGQLEDSIPPQPARPRWRPAPERLPRHQSRDVVGAQSAWDYGSGATSGTARCPR